jgi:putative colanic acid biosynthesis acetyltransferase WcaF
MKTNPIAFRNPHSWRNKGGRLLWRFVYLFFFRPSPCSLYAWRSWLLCLFGAKIRFAHLHPTVRVWAPWLLELGEYVYIDRDVNLYNVFGISIADRVIISEKAYLCGASHDYKVPSYPLTGGKVMIKDDCWLAADSFVGPGVCIGEGVVVGARAVVFKDVEPWTVVAGNPAKFIKKRTLDTADIA